ncbi:hypothetical protein H0E87_022977 [Populus deltoides]|uniref:non-specific serine/threonine protein kinase n=1 Tax=Populus deltoides TaxID=3696 RepID=A0A8T2XBU2_POPDE|nr:hypothetical protein H0E87_022977 [Populus deltoides]
MPPLEPMCGDDLNIVDLITPEKPVLKTNSKLHSVQSRIKSYLPDHDLNIVDLITPEKPVLKTNSKPHSVQSRIKSYLPSKDVLKRNSLSQKSSSMLVCDEGCEGIEGAIKKLSLASTSTLSDHDYGDPFAALLAVCGQSVPLTLLEVFSKYCEPDNIVKVGEGTYGEAFEAGNTVCKIVPIDGDLPVNGEVQKRSEELLKEVILSRTLDNIRSHDSDVDNACRTFIEILDLRVCEGPYDPALVRAWEYWDERHGSENDHPKEFPEKQCFVVFVLQHGGKDLESFVLLNFDEVHSLLVQVTAGLAIAEAAYEFEHRDLHCFPKTNVLWLIYLVDILLLKKSFDRSSKNEGDLHSLKKRLSKYNSAKEAIILDPFFSNLLVL